MQRVQLRTEEGMLSEGRLPYSTFTASGTAYGDPSPSAWTLVDLHWTLVDLQMGIGHRHTTLQSDP